MTEFESITFFIDRCLGKKHIVEILRAANIRVEIHDDHFGKNAPDMDWIPEIDKTGWIVLTKDANIGKNQLERLTVADANARMFVLASQNLSGTDIADIFLHAIPEMREFIRNNPAPFIAKIYREGKVKSWKDNLDLLTELNKFLG
jgi:predicted nuclease of predicted toxin-antitoxin system